MKTKLNITELLAKRKLEVNKSNVPLPDKPIIDKPIIDKPALTLAERILAIKQARESNQANDKSEPEPVLKPLAKAIQSVNSVNSSQGMHGEVITYNKEQLEFITMAAEGKSCILIGAAGTGKTTCSQGAIKALINSGNIPALKTDGHKHLVSGAPGIIITAYTRRAVNNSRKIQSEDFKSNCITIHKLLEYAPVYYESIDPETENVKRTMRFEPTRCANNPLPSSIRTIIIEEASMVGTDLAEQLFAACAHPVQFIYIGDIQQLPPVFGRAILGFKMLELPTVELTQVYRQALESPIIRLAHRILSGNPIPVTEFPEWYVPNKLTLHPWKKKLSAEHAAMTLCAFFKGAIDKNIYDPEEDTILIPFTVGCGTIEINNNIANFLARKRAAVTYEIMAGFNKHYFSVGDKVLYDKEDAEIIAIETNHAYTGAKVQKESIHLDYWGHNPKAVEERDLGSTETLVNADMLLSSLASQSTEDRVTQASHSVTVRLLDSEIDSTVSKAAEINTLLHSYALTVHKSQGSEWRKVFVCLHQSHNTMLARELLYTGCTRAREELYVICEPESFIKGIVKQRVKGNTLLEKAEFFKGKL